MGAGLYVLVLALHEEGPCIGLEAQLQLTHSVWCVSYCGSSDSGALEIETAADLRSAAVAILLEAHAE